YRGSLPPGYAPAAFARSWVTLPTPASGWQRCAGHRGTGEGVSLLPTAAAQRSWAKARGPSGSHPPDKKPTPDPDTLVPAATSLPPVVPCAVSELRSEERRVGKECRARCAQYHVKKNTQ